MIWVAVFFGFLVFVILIFLTVPIVCYIDTREQRYEIYQWGIFSCMFPAHRPFRPRVKLFGIQLPAKEKKAAVQVGEKPKTKKSSFLSKKTFRAWRFLITRSVSSFSVKSLMLNVDTGDVITNARLVPLMVLLSRGPVDLQTNFTGHVYVHFEMRNRLGRLVWIFLQFLTKK